MLLSLNLKRAAALAGLTVVTFFAARAGAEILPPGGFAEDLASNLTDRPDFGGNVVATQTIPFTLSDDSLNGTDLSAEIVNKAVRDPATNTLTFYYTIANSSKLIMGVDDLITSEFKGYSTDVAILTDTTGETAPIDALRDNDGKAITFEFDSDAARISSTGTSFTFLVKTNAKNFDNDGQITIDAFSADSTEEGSARLGSGSAKIESFRPIGAPAAVAVPLPPASLAAIPTLLGAAFLMRRSRKSVAL